MSTYESEYPSRGGPRLVLILLLVALMIGAIMLAMSRQGVILGTHAVEKHGADALAVQKCLEDKDPLMVFKHKFQPTYYLMCEIEKDTLFGIQAVSEDGFEKTSFIPGNGSLKEVLEYFGNWATKFSKAYPWR